MRFEDDERKPGENTNIILNATPGSRVAFVAVDKSLLLLKTGNELTKEKVCAECVSVHGVLLACVAGRNEYTACQFLIF